MQGHRHQERPPPSTRHATCQPLTHGLGQAPAGRQLSVELESAHQRAARPRVEKRRAVPHEVGELAVLCAAPRAGQDHRLSTAQTTRVRTLAQGNRTRPTHSVGTHTADGTRWRRQEVQNGNAQLLERSPSAVSTDRHIPRQRAGRIPTTNPPRRGNTACPATRRSSPLTDRGERSGAHDPPQRWLWLGSAHPTLGAPVARRLPRSCPWHAGRPRPHRFPWSTPCRR